MSPSAPAREAVHPQLDFLPIRQCPIAAPLLWRATEALLRLATADAAASDAAALNPAALNPAALWLQAADQLELFTTADETRLQITLYLRRPGRNTPDPTGLDRGGSRPAPLAGLFAPTIPSHLVASFHAFCGAAQARVPELSGAGITLLPTASPDRSRRGEPSNPGPSWGSPGLMYTVSPAHPDRPATPQMLPMAYWVPRGAFFQINRFLLPELLTHVTWITHNDTQDATPDAPTHDAPTRDSPTHDAPTRDAPTRDAPTRPRTGALAWDLYAGIGFFAQAFARNFRQVVAVEIAEPAASALAATKLPNLRAVKSTTLDFLKAVVVQRERPDLIVLDPPRTGAGPEICTLLARIAAPTLIYVSCNPEALAADLLTLTASGYTVAELRLFDLFPQTTHIETVAILHRPSAPAGTKPGKASGTAPSP